MPALLAILTLALAQPAPDPDVLTAAQAVCSSLHPDAALTGLLKLAGKPEGVELGQAWRSALDCLKDIQRAPIPAGAAGPPVAPALADALCACRDPMCTFDALRQTYPGEVTAEARARAAECLRGGYRAVLASLAMRDEICACPDMACARQASDRGGERLLALRDMRGTEADIETLKASGEATVACLTAIVERSRRAGGTSGSAEP